MTITPLDLARIHGIHGLAQITAPPGFAPPPDDLLLATLRGEDRAGWTPEEQAAADAAAATIQAAVDTANAMIGRVSAGRVLSEDESRLLAAYATDIARYRLYDEGVLADDDPVNRRAEAAVRFLERVGAGTETLGVAPLGGAGAPVAWAPERQFRHDTLKDY
ncbi:MULTISPECIES: phage protein Gp36 family protein [Marichromatium]|uniref:Uncharacterized protein DUF1320 n=1 Tax=Marichromatium gracile TaxID=1048 RepID=A0A4R4A511_MARGR|nr:MULTISPECIES: phage protein Gp36 family protein [Marichromatium]MBK1709805.1 hypothetical protein [Marichromatium gracile]RNE89873.1 DUF1320 domain-containing protein [Marichromatium sp. AB31]TCW32685.1 uncharacterized protein DUF1320 [Marichromatium gracile]